VVAITNARLGCDDARPVGVRLDLLPQLAHQYPQVLDVDRLLSPNFLQELLVRHHQPGVRGKQMQKAVFLAGQLNALPIERHGARYQVHRELPRLHDGILVGASESAPQGGVGSRQQFSDSERLNDVVVRAQS
jgi:hypothetical protein